MEAAQQLDLGINAPLRVPFFLGYSSSFLQRSSDLPALAPSSVVIVSMPDVCTDISPESQSLNRHSTGEAETSGCQMPRLPTPSEIQHGGRAQTRSDHFHLVLNSMPSGGSPCLVFQHWPWLHEIDALAVSIQHPFAPCAIFRPYQSPIVKMEGWMAWKEGFLCFREGSTRATNQICLTSGKASEFAG